MKRRGGAQVAQLRRNSGAAVAQGLAAAVAQGPAAAVALEQWCGSCSGATAAQVRLLRVRQRAWR